MNSEAPRYGVCLIRTGMQLPPEDALYNTAVPAGMVALPVLWLNGYTDAYINIYSPAACDSGDRLNCTAHIPAPPSYVDTVPILQFDCNPALDNVFNFLPDEMMPHHAIPSRHVPAHGGNRLYDSDPVTGSAPQSGSYNAPPPPMPTEQLDGKRLDRLQRVHCQWPDCPSSFTRRSDLNRHVREKHLNVRHWCALCGRSFQRKDQLKQHQRPGGSCCL